MEQKVNLAATTCFKVAFLTTFKHAFLAFPLQKWKKDLAIQGVEVQIASVVPKNMRNFDTVIITNAFCVSHAKMLRVRKKPHDYAKELVNNLREMGLKVIFFDSRDGTPSSWFEILPYVDLFIKRQVLKDKNAYTKVTYADKHSIWLQGREPKPITPARRDQVDKIRLAWNIGLEDFGPNRKLGKIASWYGFTWSPSTTPPNRQRSIATTFRGSLGGSRYQHRQLAIDAINSTGHDRCIAGGSISRREYLSELKASKTTVSPFGFGEPCYRDFEAVLAGSTLIKPSMDHLETFPDIYIPWSTYVPVSWDFSDFSDHLNEILVSDDSRVAMARKAQDVYLNHLNNHELFCQHFLGILFAAHHLENAH